MPQRLFWLDALRLFALLGMMIIHISAIGWYQLPVGSFAWQSLNAWDGLCRGAVPLFIMISGSLFLNPERPFSIKRLYRKNIVHIITVYLLWSLLYALIGLIGQPWPGLRAFVILLLRGHYHMWFLITLVGLYVLVPILRPVVKIPSVTTYYVALGFLLTSILPFYTIATRKPVPNVIDYLLRTFEISNMFGFTLYFVAGWWLMNLSITPLRRILIYMCAGLSLAATVGLNARASLRAAAPVEQFFSYLVPFIVLSSFALFLIARDTLGRFTPGDRLQTLCNRLGADGLGIYMLSALPIAAIQRWGSHILLVHPALTIPLAGLITFITCAIGAGLIRRIPLINRYLL